MDTTLTFFTTASLLCFFLWHQYPKEGSLSQKPLKDLTIYGFYAGMGLATLVKGPLGFILPLFISLIYLVIQKDWEGMKRMKLLTGMALFLVIVLSWYLPAVVKGGEDYLHATLLRQTVARYADGWSKARPIYYYLYNFPIDFLPWVFFIPAAVAYGFSREKVEKRREFLFLFIWLALIFIFFSLSKGKRAIYLLPLYPAAALMVGKLWDDFVSTPMEHFRNTWISVPLYGLMGVILVAGAALPWVLSIKFPSYLPYGLPITFLLVGGSLVMFVLYRFKNYSAIISSVGIVAGKPLLYAEVILPVVNQYKSARFMAREITTRIQPGEKLAVYGRISTGPFNYYTGIVPILDLAEMKDVISLLESSERTYCLLDYKGFSQFRKWKEDRRCSLFSSYG
jgi:4-amino-4-deoxy-L-arabinose transferase-like glycosyltransferase